jgi:hypothetical protein
VSNFINAIREYLGLGLSRADAVALAQAESQPTNGPTVPPMTPSGVEAVIERKRKRRYKGRVVYVPTVKASTNGAADNLVPSHAMTLAAVVNAKRPVTAREVESLASQKRKTVESSLWNLRQMGLVQSISRDSEPAITAAMQALAPAKRKTAKRRTARK